jgi:hypothetical protein
MIETDRMSTIKPCCRPKIVVIGSLLPIKYKTLKEALVNPSIKAIFFRETFTSDSWAVEVCLGHGSYVFL